MNTRAPRFSWRLLALAGVTAFGASMAFAADAPERNPFERPGSAPPPPTNSDSPIDKLEFRGMWTISGKTTVTLFDPGKSKSYTVPVGGALGDIRVTGYQETGNTVSVEMGGRRRTIEKFKSKIVPLAAAPQVPAAPGVAGGSPTLVPGAVGPGSDQDPNARMAKVAEEIRRRRAMRRQMLDPTVQQPAAPQPPRQ